MTSATIKLFLPQGDPKGLRTAEISNWTGMAIAAPRTDLDELLGRPEISRSGVYFLTGSDPRSDAPMAYIGEAEDIGKRLRQHTAKEFWVQAVVFVSKDKALTRAHIQYIEGKLIAEAQQMGRVKLDNTQGGGAKLPESDQADMEVFLMRMRQLLPVLGLDLLTPFTTTRPPLPGSTAGSEEVLLYHKIKDLQATGMRTSTGFVVFAGSRAVREERGSAPANQPWVLKLRQQLLDQGIFAEEDDHLLLVKDHEFTTPSQAASVLVGGYRNGLRKWRDASGKTLKEIESS